MAVASVLKNRDAVTLPELPRMADFAITATAAESALGFKQGSFLEAYTRNRDDIVDAALQSDQVADAIRSLVDGGADFEGLAKDLLSRLDQIVGEATMRTKAWPKSPRGLSGQVRRCAPFLRTIGIQAETDDREGHGGRRVIRICRDEALRKAGDATVSTATTDSSNANSQPNHTVREESTADGCPGADGPTVSSAATVSSDRQHVNGSIQRDIPSDSPIADDADGRSPLFSADMEEFEP
jgi:hypothetical protein